MSRVSVIRDGDDAWEQSERMPEKDRTKVPLLLKISILENNIIYLQLDSI